MLVGIGKCNNYCVSARRKYHLNIKWGRFDKKCVWNVWLHGFKSNLLVSKFRFSQSKIHISFLLLTLYAVKHWWKHSTIIGLHDEL